VRGRPRGIRNEIRRTAKRIIQPVENTKKKQTTHKKQCKNSSPKQQSYMKVDDARGGIESQCMKKKLLMNKKKVRHGKCMLPMALQTQRKERNT
jgi:hypothetical protein